MFTNLLTRGVTLFIQCQDKKTTDQHHANLFWSEMLSVGCPYDTSFNACQRTSTKGLEGRVPLGLFPLIDEPKVSGTAPVSGGPRSSGIREVTDEEGDDAELKPAMIMETHLPSLADEEGD